MPEASIPPSLGALTAFYDEATSRRCAAATPTRCSRISKDNPMTNHSVLNDAARALFEPVVLGTLSTINPDGSPPVHPRRGIPGWRRARALPPRLVPEAAQHRAEPEGRLHHASRRPTGWEHQAICSRTSSSMASHASRSATRDRGPIDSSTSSKPPCRRERPSRGRRCPQTAADNPTSRQRRSSGRPGCPRPSVCPELDPRVRPTLGGTFMRTFCEHNSPRRPETRTSTREQEQRVCRTICVQT